MSDDAQTRGGKYCPQCTAMARLDAAECLNCGHRFSTGLTLTPTDALHEPLSEAELNRTRAFTLPPLPARAPAGDATAPTVLSDAEVADLERSLAAVRRPRWHWAYAVFALAVVLGGALWWWLAGRV